MDINFNITINQNGNQSKYVNKMGLFFGQNRFSQIPPVVTSNIKYGRLYNWYAASNALFAPEGWHVPTQEELEELITYLGGVNIAGGKLKETGFTYWAEPNEGATNEVNFFHRGASWRTDQGIYQGLLEAGNILTSTLDLNEIIYALYDYFDSSDCSLSFQHTKPTGASYRLLKDDSVLIPSLTDLDGNIYRTTKIGNQVWLADNWACTKLNNNTPIPNVTVAEDWAALTTGAYCNYNNDESNVFL